MENKSSDEYIAELLKQLDELKRKKALKERKLQKLKTSAVVDRPKEQVCKVTPALCCQTDNKLLCENSSKLVSDNDDCKKHSFNVPECTKAQCAKTEKYKENCTHNSFALGNREQLKLKKNFLKNLVFEDSICNRDVNNQKTIHVTSNSDCNNFEKIDSKLKTSCDTLAISLTEKSCILNENDCEKNSLNSNLNVLSQGDSYNTEKFFIEVNREICNESEEVDTVCHNSEKKGCKRLKKSCDTAAVFSTEESFIVNENVGDKYSLNSKCDHLSQGCKTKEFYIQVNKEKCNESEMNVNEEDTFCHNVEKKGCKQLKKSDTLAVSSTGKSFILNESNGEKISLNSKGGILSQGKVSHENEKFYIEVNTEKYNESKINVEDLENNKDDNKNSVLSLGSESSFCNISQKDNSLKKSLSAKERSCDSLNDSLNSNMSCFLSSEFFPADDQTQELVFENKSLMTHGHENTEHIQTSEQIRAAISVVPDSVCKKTEENNNLDGFNFPKFSTPTDGINFLSSSDENIKSQNNPVEQNPSDIKTSATESVCSVIEPCKNDNKDKNILDTAQVNLIIGKGLCSVLDAHYVSPDKSSQYKNVLLNIDSKEIPESKVVFKEKFSEKNCEKNSTGSCDSFKGVIIDNENLKSTDEFTNMSASFLESVNYVNNSFFDVPSQVTKTVNGLVDKICEDSENVMNIPVASVFDSKLKADSEVLVIPETEGVGLYFSNNTDDFLETSTLSESLNDFCTKDNLLNISSQSRLESPVVNKIVAAVKSARDASNYNNGHFQNVENNGLTGEVAMEVEENACDSHLVNTSTMETSLFEDDTQDLGNYKQVPYINKNDVEYTSTLDSKSESNLNFLCSLHGASNEAVVDVEIILFGDVKYAFILHQTAIHVWRQEKKKEWIKIFNHQVENMLSLVKICWTKDEKNLVIVMLLSNGQQYCLQFLLFEKDAAVIKLMEHTHWLEKRHSLESVLMCGLEGLMFATAQQHSGYEVSLHAFIGLKDSPRLMTAVLGSTDSALCSLCKIDNLPNALLAVGPSMLYVWV